MTAQRNPNAPGCIQQQVEKQTNDRLAYSVAEAAEVLGISRPTLYTLLHRSDFPAFRIGGRVLVSVDGLRLWVATQTGATDGGQTDG